jgi:hypothetical protein
MILPATTVPGRITTDMTKKEIPPNPRITASQNATTTAAAVLTETETTMDKAGQKRGYLWKRSP